MVKYKLGANSILVKYRNEFNDKQRIDSTVRDTVYWMRLLMVLILLKSKLTFCLVAFESVLLLNDLKLRAYVITFLSF